MVEIRKALRALRKQHWKNNRVAAKAMGIGASTVAKVENLKGEPDYDPGIGIVSAFILAAGKLDPELTLSSFIDDVERQTESDLPNPAVPSRTTPAPKESVKDGRRSAVPLDASKLLAAGNALIDAGGLFIAAAEGVEVDRLPRKARHARPGQPKKTKSGAAHR